jgi:hypothetical protein
MSFEINDTVRVVSLVESKYSVIGVHPTMLILANSQAEGEVIEISSGLGGINIDFGSITFWFHIDDVELVELEDVSLDDFAADPVLPVPLDFEDIEEGDQVQLLDPTCYPDTVESCTPFSLSDVTATDTFDIEDLDAGDESVQVEDEEGNSCWVYAKDLTSAEINISETEVEGKEPYVEDPTEELDDVTFIITNDSVTLSIDGKTDVVAIGSPNFAEIQQAVMAGDYKTAHGLMNTAIGIERWGNGSLQIDSGVVTYHSMPLTGKLVDRVIDMMAQGDETFKRFANFLNLTMEQESYTTRARLMDFAANGKLDLTEEGYVVAFKNVSDNFFDRRSGLFDNNVGNTLSMRRSDVDDDHEHQCSNGLHVCSPTYLKECWGTAGRTMRVVVEPRDFVAIPYDYADSKARVCRYTVVEDVTDQLEKYLN